MSSEAEWSGSNAAPDLRTKLCFACALCALWLGDKISVRRVRQKCLTKRIEAQQGLCTSSRLNQCETDIGKAKLDMERIWSMGISAACDQISQLVPIGALSRGHAAVVDAVDDLVNSRRRGRRSTRPARDCRCPRADGRFQPGRRRPVRPSIMRCGRRGGDASEARMCRCDGEQRRVVWLWRVR